MVFLEKIQERGGTAYLIGGAVIDTINNLPIKDWDIEVFDLSLSELEEILLSIGLPVNMVGTSFGVIKTKVNGVEFDISIPRRENKIGAGHTDFLIETDPEMTIEEASLRRDLTINAMYKNLHTGEIVDPQGGLADLSQGIIRATNDKTFVEDPLRVLRIMQIFPRKGKYVDSGTVDLCRSISDTFSSLPKERIFEEFSKLLLKSNKPSLGLAFLRECGWLQHFPELFNLIGCPQNPIHHPEGDVWNHTLLVVDNAAKLRDNLPSELSLAYMFAALLHDIGKPATTNELLQSYGHDDYGAELVPVFMGRLTNEVSLIHNVTELVRLHMRPGQLFSSGASKPAWRRLHNLFRLDVLGWLHKADSAGRTGRSINDLNHVSALCFHYFDTLGEAKGEKIAPLLQGRDLIRHGMSPSPQFKVILDKAYELQMDGLTKEEIEKILL